VETFSVIPQIILKGAEWFAGIGYKKSTGTKTFSMAGDVKNTGLIEVPFGITLREIIYDVGGGIKDDKNSKLCKPAAPWVAVYLKPFSTCPWITKPWIKPGPFLVLAALVVMDEGTCMVDIARFFMEFTQEESCGKCTPCRIGTRRLLEILTRICEGKGKTGRYPTLRTYANKSTKTACADWVKAHQIQSKARWSTFLDEYEAHIFEKRCPAKVCKALIRFEIIDGPCTGCTLCARNCPVDAISGERRQLHVIDPDICIQCGICEQLCPYDAIEIR
jgi:NADH:ubiquinone oxidoreductase subunit F (NADH-binding)/Pyruvate/2-oxoacid:ferredoxin oxidoreductase delta subunit